MTTTDNMGLILGTVSETLGPEWAELLNAALLVVDAHDHTSGNGVPITPSAMNINDNIDMDGYDLENAGAVYLDAQEAVDTDKEGSLQQYGNDLYWVSGAGASVRLTAGGSPVSSGSGVISATTPGAYPYTVSTADAQTVLAADTSSARTFNLPAATDAMFFMIKDATGQAATNNISVVPDGTDTIDGSNSTYLIDANLACVGFVSDGVSAWLVV